MEHNVELDEAVNLACVTAGSRRLLQGPCWDSMWHAIHSRQMFTWSVITTT